jgi:hypothetical protein
MAYDSERAVAVVFGGRTSFGTVSDTWEWDGSTWHNKSGIAGQPYFFCCPRADAAMAYDSRLGQMVVFGGYGASRDATWVLQPLIVFGNWQNSGTQNGSDAYPFRTIRQAVDTPGCGTIRVQSGDYPEGSFSITKPRAHGGAPWLCDYTLRT